MTINRTSLTPLSVAALPWLSQADWLLPRASTDPVLAIPRSRLAIRCPTAVQPRLTERSVNRRLPTSP